MTAKYNIEQQQTYYNTFPAGSTDQHLTFLYVFLLSPGNGNFHWCILFPSPSFYTGLDKV